MKLFAQLKNLIFNPKELLNKEGRITKYRSALAFDNRTKLWIKPGNKTTLEYYYLRTPGKEITEDEYDPTQVEIDTNGALVPPTNRSHLDF